MLVSKAGGAELCLAVPERAWSSQDVARGERTELLCLTSPMNQHNT